jgi:SAM-dependent methyltransferase
MTELPALGACNRLDFHGPLSSARADRFVGRLAAQCPQTLVDYGCGWGELLLRALDRCPQARGIGIDTHGADIERARRNAVARGLADRVEFIEGSATDHLSSGDVLLSVGAYHAFGTIPEALAVLADAVNPGGRLLFAAEIWERPPTAGELANMWPDTSADACVDLPTLAELAVKAGFRLLRVETSTSDEWDEFEFGLTVDHEEWLLANPEATDRAAELDTRHARYVRGTRGVMGFAFLLLGRPTRTDG